MAPLTQMAIVQPAPEDSKALGLAVNQSTPVPKVHTRHRVLILVLAVAINPTDHKMILHSNCPGGITGCDFCGIVEETTAKSGVSHLPPGIRVSGALFPYGLDECDNGAFAQYIVADSPLLVKVPEHWSDLEAASLGVGWSTLSLALSDPSALGLEGTPTKPVHSKGDLVVIYGGGTASGTFGLSALGPHGLYSNRCNLYQIGTVGDRHLHRRPQGSRTKADPPRSRLHCGCRIRGDQSCGDRPHRRQVCTSRGIPVAWRTMKAAKVKEVMGFQVLGVDMNFGADSPYTRPADEGLAEIGRQWAAEIEALMESRKIKAYPLRELQDGWDGIIRGMEVLRKGELQGQKLVVRIPQT
ncbi:chaperonin 10-like protein [Aspergillus fruticulosus]